MFFQGCFSENLVCRISVSAAAVRKPITISHKTLRRTEFSFYLKTRVRTAKEMVVTGVFRTFKNIYDITFQ